jgi:hypothetical protein
VLPAAAARGRDPGPNPPRRLLARRIVRARHVVFASSVATRGNTVAETPAEDGAATLAGMSPAAASCGITELLGGQLDLLYALKHGVGFGGMRFSSSMESGGMPER